MDHTISERPQSHVPVRQRHVRARGTDVSFAMACDEALADSLDQAIERGIELFSAEQSARLEQRFYSGR